jgi:ethanolamine utilization protein EutQ (cupin superfamily)
MVKTNKNLTLDVEIIKKFSKNNNFSGLVEQLLREYIEKNKPLCDKIAQKKFELKQKKKEIKELKKEMKEITYNYTIESMIIKQKEEIEAKNVEKIQKWNKFEHEFLEWNKNLSNKMRNDLKNKSKLDYFRKNIYKGGEDI